MDEVRHFLYSSQRPLLVVQGHKTKQRLWDYETGFHWKMCCTVLGSSHPADGGNIVTYRVYRLSCLHAPSAHDVYLLNFHAKLDKAISIEDVKALLSAEVMFAQSI